MNITIQSSDGTPAPARLFEWLMAAAMVGIAVILLLDPLTLSKGLFRYLYAMGVGPYMLSGTLAIAGAGRLIGLWMNGRWEHSSKVRFLGCVVGGIAWFHMMLALIAVTKDTTAISVGIPVYAALCLGEVLSCYRAALDGRNNL